jgi:hypothetical protein
MGIFDKAESEAEDMAQKDPNLAQQAQQSGGGQGPNQQMGNQDQNMGNQDPNMQSGDQDQNMNQDQDQDQGQGQNQNW